MEWKSQQFLHFSFLSIFSTISFPASAGLGAF
jgi:hypothetical protein